MSLDHPRLVRAPRPRLAAPGALLVATAALLPRTGHAAGCQVAPGTAVVALATCDYGVPARSGDLLLVPKVCRTPVDGKILERQAVEVRRAATGAKIGQAALPAVAVKGTVPLPLPGVLLGGDYPLLVSAAGIAALEPRVGRAELVYEPEGKFLGVARHGEVLAIVEQMAPDDHFPKGSLEWTVLDYGAGEVIGQLRLAGQDVEGLSVRPAAGGGLEAVLERRVAAPARPGAAPEAPKRVEVVAPVRDAHGKSAAPGGSLQAKVRPANPPTGSADQAGPGQCPLLAPASTVLLARPRLVVGTAAGAGATPEGQVAVPGPDACLAVQELDASGHAWGWFRTAAGARELRPLQCQK